MADGCCRGAGAFVMQDIEPRRLGAVLAVLAWAVGLWACAGTAAAQSKPPAPCQAYAPGVAPAGGRAYRVPRLTEPGNPGRCDVSHMAVATHDDGLFRDVYGGNDVILPEKAVGPVIAHLWDQVRCDAAKANCTLRILVFAHGGRVPQSQATADAERLAPAMMADGYAPVFLIWNSDDFTTYGDRLCCVTQGEKDLNPIHWVVFAPTRLAGDIVASAARAPENYAQQIIRFQDSVTARGGTQYFLEPGDLDPRTGICGLVDPCPRIEYPSFGARDLLNGQDQTIPERGFKYYAFWPLRLGTTTFTPQIGAAAWDNMVRRTRLAVQDPTLGIADQNRAAEALARRFPDYDARLKAAGNDCERDTIKAGAPYELALKDTPRSRFTTTGEGAFLVFFDRLTCEVAAMKAAGVHVEIDYFGHSMGALIGNEILARRPELPWRRIVYMAAATPTRDVRLMVSNLLSEDRPELRFFNLMLHPLAESHDLEVLGIVPEGSLLEWIDEMFGGPKTVDDRMFGKWTNAEKTMSMFPRPVRQRMTFRVFPAQSRMSNGNDAEMADFAAQCAVIKGGRTPPRCHPIKHGEFVDYAFWRDHYLCAQDLSLIHI